MSQQLNALTKKLHASGELKVWSLIITFFGDSIVNRGGNIAASTVQKVFDKVDIGDGALRTAFSRLASDGWIDRDKQGRRSFYQLTSEGISPFSQASKRIYSPVIKQTAENGVWLLGVHNDKAAIDDVAIAGALRLPNRTLLIFNPDKLTLNALEQRGFLSVTGHCTEIPDWVANHFCPPDWAQQINQLRDNFSSLSSKPTTDPLTALVVRTLLIHQWRRLLLRYPPIPAVLKRESLKLEDECREFVGHMYQQLTLPAEFWLNEHGATKKGALPAASSNPADRFTPQFLK